MATSDNLGEEDSEVDEHDDCEYSAEIDTEMNDLSEEDSNQANKLERKV